MVLARKSIAQHIYLIFTWMSHQMIASHFFTDNRTLPGAKNALHQEQMLNALKFETLSAALFPANQLPFHNDPSQIDFLLSMYFARPNKLRK